MAQKIMLDPSQFILCIKNWVRISALIFFIIYLLYLFRLYKTTKNKKYIYKYKITQKLVKLKETKKTIKLHIF